ncbi:MAG: TIR domain-containing protein [Synechococcus sp.]
MRSVRIHLANKIDRKVLPCMGGGNAAGISVPQDLMKALGVEEGARVRVIDFQKRVSIPVRAYHTDFQQVGVSRPVREALGWALNPQSTPGISPYRNLQIRITPFEYDFAISYASERRDYARGLAEQLTSAGFQVFFDQDKRHVLHGRFLPEVFDRIYGGNSDRYAVLVSREYLEKRWTMLEFQTIKSWFISQNRDLLFPIQLDEAQLPEMEDLAYLDGRSLSIAEVAEVMVQGIFEEE